MNQEHADYIWNYFSSRLGNEYGVAGLMGNLQAESGLCPHRLQGDFSSGYEASLTYTALVDTGAITESDFVYNGPNGGGYGLAQWTYPPRKQALYNMWKGGYPSIGDIRLACDYLWQELKTDYKGVLSVLQSAESVREASDSVLHDFENPANQSEATEKARAALGNAWYEHYTGNPPPDVVPTTKKKGMSLLLMCLATRSDI